MKNSTLIHDITPEQFQEIILEIVKNQFELLKKEFKPKEPTEYLTRSEVSEMLKCDISSVHNWTKSGRLVPYGISNRVYYKRSEVEAALKPFGKNKGEKEL